MCKWGSVKRVKVKIPSDLSCDGRKKFKYVKIDKCISRLVKALQMADIDMRGSCCGHNKTFGDIHLQDGRVFVILDAEWYYSGGREKLIKLYKVKREGKKDA